MAEASTHAANSDSCLPQIKIHYIAVVMTVAAIATVVLGVVGLLQSVGISSQVSYCLIGGGGGGFVIAALLFAVGYYRHQKREASTPPETTIEGVHSVTIRDPAETENVMNVKHEPEPERGADEVLTEVSYTIDLEWEGPATHPVAIGDIDTALECDPSLVTMMTSLLLFLEPDYQQKLKQPAQLSRAMWDTLQTAMRKLNPAPLFLFSSALTSNDQVQVSYKWVALACLFAAGSCTEVDKMLDRLIPCQENFSIWYSNVCIWLNTDVAPACNAIPWLYECAYFRAYSLLNRISSLESFVQRVYEMRALAHSAAYCHPQVGYSDPLIGDVIWVYNHNGVFIYATTRKNLDETYTVQLFCAGTHEIQGVIRDLRWSLPDQEIKELSPQAVVDMIEVMKQIFGHEQNVLAQKKTIEVLFHGHSLGGHDAQVLLVAFLEQAYPVFTKNYGCQFTRLTVNTQNSLKVSRKNLQQFQKLTQGIQVPIFCHHGIVEGDLVQRAGDTLLHGQKSQPDIHLEIVKLQPTGAVTIMLGTHTLAAHTSTPEKIPDSMVQRYLWGSSTLNYGKGVVAPIGHVLHAVTHVTSLFKQQPLKEESPTSDPDSNTGLTSLDSSFLFV